MGTILSFEPKLLDKDEISPAEGLWIRYTKTGPRIFPWICENDLLEGGNWLLYLRKLSAGVT